MPSGEGWHPPPLKPLFSGIIVVSSRGNPSGVLCGINIHSKEVFIGRILLFIVFTTTAHAGWLAHYATLIFRFGWTTPCPRFPPLPCCSTELSFFLPRIEPVFKAQEHFSPSPQ